MKTPLTVDPSAGRKRIKEDIHDFVELIQKTIVKDKEELVYDATIGMYRAVNNQITGLRFFLNFEKKQN